MEPFEFAFTLFGLVLGLAIAAVLQGFVDVLRHRRTVRLGWLTPLLGMIVILDLITFWNGAWANRDEIPINFVSLVGFTLVAGTYFAAASLVFPKEPKSGDDYDVWFFQHKAWVAAGIAVANILFSAGEFLMFGNFSPDEHLAQYAYILAAGGLALTRRKLPSLLLIVVLLGLLVGAGVQAVLAEPGAPVEMIDGRPAGGG